MLKPYKSDITDIAVIFAHAGTREDSGNRIYSIAVTILSSNSPARTFESFVRYPYLTARDRYYSNVSKEKLSNAPEASEVFKQIRNFLKDTELVLTLPYQDNYEDIKKICYDKRIIDLGFTVEFFLPHVDSFSPKRLWEYLHRQERKQIYFAASEVTSLSTELIEHICGNELNDSVFPQAAAIRYYLEKSNTLYGSIFIHLARNYEKYFGALFNPCQRPDTENWKAFLEPASAKQKKKQNTNSIKKIHVEKLETIYRGLSQSEKGFTFRPSQVEYASHVAQAINCEAVITIESGTGTGKTQGYLIPVMEFLSRNSDARIAISTYTKSLQNQIFQQEIAFVRHANKFYSDIPVSLLKGKSNYICAEKLGSTYNETWQGRTLLTWLYFVNLTYHFRDTDGAQIGHRISHYLEDGPFFHQLQREVSARSGCDAKHTRCPAQVITAEASAARLIVTNHHKLMLLNSDPILGELFKTYIIDEANHFEQAAGNALGQEFSSRDTDGFLEYLESVITKLLGRAVDKTEKDIKETIAAITELKKAMLQFGEILKSIRSQTNQSKGHQELPATNTFYKEGQITKNLEALRYEIRRIAEHLEWLKNADICRMLKIQERTQERLKRNLADLMEQELSLKIMTDAYINPNQIVTYDAFSRHWAIFSRPVDVSNLIRENLYRDTKGVVYTSATIGINGNYETFKQIVGMDRPFFLNKEKKITREFQHIFLGSPFSSARAEMIVPNEAVQANYINKSNWINYVVKILPELIKKNKGRTLVLFSSYQDLEAVAKRIRDEIVEAGFPLLIQRNGYPTDDLCDEFRAVKESVLFGVDTFWYGVDFKGDTLTQVIITRIPYPHPGDALNIARKKTMPPAKYMDRYLYDTYIKMKQGIGRLIRSENDYGKVVVLDSRFLRIKDKFFKQDDNKIDALHEIDDRQDQIQIAFSDNLNDELNEPYIFHCGTCGEEISAEALVCSACNQKFKEDRKPHYQTPKKDCLEFQKGPDCLIPEELHVNIEKIIKNENEENSLLEESDQMGFVQDDFVNQPISNNLNAKTQKAEVIRLLREERLSSAEIAERVGVSAPTVWGYKAHLTMGNYDTSVKRKDMQLRGHFEIKNIVQPLGESASYDMAMESIKHLISKIPIKKPAGSITDRRLLEIRHRYSRAYEPWSNEEDILLLKLSNEKRRNSVLAKIFQRQPSAITSRIRKLKGSY